MTIQVDAGRKKICIVVSSEMTVRAFLMDQIAALSRLYDVTVVANMGNGDFLDAMGIRANVRSLRIERKISPLRDMTALFGLVRLFRTEGFDAVHSVTPKAGLLSMAAGWIAGVPRRSHTFTGQVWATSSGAKRWLLKAMDRLLVAFATNILADSRSQREFLVEQGVVSSEKSRVLEKGSISGVDTERFCPDPEERARTRESLGIRDDDLVVLFLGRLNRDKGVLDLAVAFSRVCINHGDLRLLMVGPDEGGMRDEIARLCGPCADNLRFREYTQEPERYMASADVFCLPSYREGFGSVIIEAAAAGVPAVGSRIYGITDAIDEGVTGLLHEAGNVEQLAGSLTRLIEDTELRRKMGEEARIRAHRDFSKERLTSAVLDYYKEILG
jgi:glycosyltransferase involved in cell wall biosynthesis